MVSDSLLANKPTHAYISDLKVVPFKKLRVWMSYLNFLDPLPLGVKIFGRYPLPLQNCNISETTLTEFIATKSVMIQTKFFQTTHPWNRKLFQTISVWNSLSGHPRTPLPLTFYMEQPLA